MTTPVLAGVSTSTKWAAILPEAATNYALNPSGETTGNFAAAGAATVTRSTTYQARGLYSYRVQGSANLDGVTFTLSALTNATHYATLLVRGTLPSPWEWSLDNVTWTAPSVLDTYGNWSFYGLSFPSAQANGSVLLRIKQTDADASDYYIDAINVVPADHWTTHIDGDQPGCTWSGAAHASTSSRSAQERSGGLVVDIDASYGVSTSAMAGFGLPPLSHNVVEQALLPGASYQSSKVQPRDLILTFTAIKSSLANYHSARDDLIELFRPDKVSPEQPVRLRYSGAGTPVEIDAYYLGGLEGSLSNQGNVERMAARFICYDPFWYELLNSATVLDGNLTVADADYAMKRVDGLWSNISTNFNGTIAAITKDAAGNIYIGGNFTNVGDANGDGIVKVAPDGTISSLGTGCNGVVHAISIGPDGTVYVGGDFTSAGGIANTSRIAEWDGSNWTALGTGAADGVVYALSISQSGNLYAGGSFTGMGGVASTGRVAMWNGSAWSAMGGGLNGNVYGMAIGLDDLPYVGGAFTGTVDYVAKYVGGSWVDMGVGFDAEVYGLAVGVDGTVYAGGNFTTPGAYIAAWNGTAWAALGTGLNNNVQELRVTASGLLYVAGVFTAAGSLSLSDGVAAWNGSSWLHLGLDLPGTGNALCVAGDDLYVGYAAAGTAYASAQTTVTNSGSRTTYPKIGVYRSGGSTARVEYLKNETTGQTIWLNYSLLDGETLTIDLTPGARKVTSSFFGNVVGRAVLPGGDFASFSLLPGANTIGLYVYEAGGPAVTAYLTYRVAHWSVDGVAA